VIYHIPELTKFENMKSVSRVTLYCSYGKTVFRCFLLGTVVGNAVFAGTECNLGNAVCGNLSGSSVVGESSLVNDIVNKNQLVLLSFFPTATCIDLCAR